MTLGGIWHRRHQSAGGFFLSISPLLNWVIVCRQRKSIIGSQVWKKKFHSNSLINIYLLVNYKTMLKGDLAKQWLLYTRPFLIYCFFYSVAFWLKKFRFNSLINIYLLVNYKTMLKGDLAKQWLLYTRPFLIYCFFYSVAFWLCQYVCLHSITKYHILT